MFCRNCGNEVVERAEICLKCGAKPLSGFGFCQTCGAVTSQQQEICIKCGVRLKSAAVGSATNTDFSGLSEYYQLEFQQIGDSKESYKGKWNWAAFFFGPIWALTKGVWLPAVIDLALCWTFFVPFAYWFVFGARGNYMYYCVQTKNKQIPV
jgi:RNA polymerase subunit RPABC4/transcription elongation factor Spt4